MANADWANYTAPAILTRNFTIRGPFNLSMSQWPTLDMGLVASKVMMMPGVALIFTHIVLYRGRKLPTFQAPGLDIIVRPKEGEPPAWLIMHNTAFIQRVCLPRNYSAASAQTLERPSVVPGKQTASALPRPADCNNSTNSTGLPSMQRCWAGYSLYADMAAYGTDYNTVTGQYDRLNYVIVSLNSTTLCERRMTVECIDHYGGTVPCYYSMFLNNDTAFMTSPPPPPQSDAALAAPTPKGAGEAGGGVGPGSRSASSSSSSSSSKLLAPLIGGVVAGIVLLAVMAAVVVFVASRRHRGSKARVDQYRKEGQSCDRPVAPSSGETWQTAPYTGETELGPRSGDTAGLPTSGETGAPTTGEATTAPPSSIKSAGGRAFMPVTPLTPVLPGVNLGIDVATEVQLTTTTLGAGAFGRVVKGLYGGVPVAVKMVNARMTAGRPGQAAVDAGDGGLRPPAPLDGTVASGSMAPAAAAPVPRPINNSNNNMVGEPGDGDAGGGGGGGGEGAAPAETAREDMDSEILECCEALVQEVEVLARCQHPNIVRLLAANVGPPQLCLVMELMDTSLERLMYRSEGKGGEPLSLPKVLHIATQIARALSYLHPTILHRDLKPGNVLLQNPGCDTPVVKLADFGLSRLLNTVLITKNPEVGTAPYMAPETFDLENMVVTDRTDIYAFGILLQEMLSGSKPWHGMNIVQIAYSVNVQGRRPPVHQLPESHCPRKLRSLVLSCWEGDPRRRPAAAEVIKVLALVQEELAAANKPQ